MLLAHTDDFSLHRKSWLQLSSTSFSRINASVRSSTDDRDPDTLREQSANHPYQHFQAPHFFSHALRTAFHYKGRISTGRARFGEASLFFISVSPSVCCNYQSIACVLSTVPASTCGRDGRVCIYCYERDTQRARELHDFLFTFEDGIGSWRWYSSWEGGRRDCWGCREGDSYGVYSSYMLN